MGRFEQQTAYCNALELAKARQYQLTSEIDVLDRRQLALLNVVKVLEEMFTRRNSQSTASPVATISKVDNPGYQSKTQNRQPLIEPVIRSYVHQSDAENDIQRRIDIAIGR